MLDAIGGDLSLKQFQGESNLVASPKTLEDGPSKLIDTFGKLLGEHLEEVNSLHEESEQLLQAYAVGQPVELHQVMIADEKADLAMKLTMQFRNKAIQAYQTIWQMNI